jgi:hypothetical protein
MLNISASLASIILTTWFLVLAWLKVYESPWLYYFGAGLLILVWSRPWSNRDRYRTYDARVRMLTYLILIGITLSASYFFLTLTPLILTLEVFFLALLESLGWRAMRRA